VTDLIMLQILYTFYDLSLAIVSSQFISLQEKNYLETKFWLPNEMVANCDQNSRQIKFWLLNNYKIEIIIKFSDQLSQDNWYLTLSTKVLVTYTFRF